MERVAIKFHFTFLYFFPNMMCYACNKNNELSIDIGKRRAYLTKNLLIEKLPSLCVCPMRRK